MRTIRDIKSIIYLSLGMTISGCALNKNFIKNYETSGSPCLDGSMVNIMGSGCSSLFWGVGRNNEVVKFRCTSPSPITSGNIWNTSTFYAVPVSFEASLPSSWAILCADQSFAVFIKPLENIHQGKDND